MAPPHTKPLRLRVHPRVQFHSLLAAVAIGAAVLALAVGCYTGPDSTLSAATPAPDASADDGRRPSRGSRAPSGGAEAGVVVADGLPCDVAALLASSCTRCHGERPTKGAPMSLVTYEDLVAPWDDDPTRTIADVALERMKATERPMPPDEPLEASAVAAFAAWVSAGTPRVACAPQPDPVDAGLAADAALADATVCSSGTGEPPGALPSALMAPGRPCLGCHAMTGGPALALAGTVYPSLHEPDGCNGAGGGNLSVVIVDAANKSHTMPVNAAGNFLRVTGIPTPYTARVVSGTLVREMKTPQVNGDCNACHSAQGTQSPGRIMAP